MFAGWRSEGVCSSVVMVGLSMGLCTQVPSESFLVYKSYKESFSNLHNDENLLWHLTEHPFFLEILSKRTEVRPRNLFLLTCCCCGLGQMFQVVLSLGNPPQRVRLCLLGHHLHGSYRYLQIPKEWRTQFLATATIYPENPCIMLDCKTERGLALLPQLTSQQGSADLNQA